MTVSISVSPAELVPALAAGALALAHKDDCRPHLECVWLHATKGRVTAYATDGTWMLGMRLPGAKARGEGHIGIPRDANIVGKLANGGARVTLRRTSKSATARWTGTNAIDLPQPKTPPPPWQRVIPRKTLDYADGGATIDPDLLVKAARAFRILRGKDATCGVAMRATGNNRLDPVALVSGDVPNALAIVMPIRSALPPGASLAAWRTNGTRRKGR